MIQTLLFQGLLCFHHLLNIQRNKISLSKLTGIFEWDWDTFKFTSYETVHSNVEEWQ